MEFIKNLKISQKLYVMVIISTLFVLLVGLVGFFYVKKGTDAISTLYSDRVLPIKQLSQIKENIDMIKVDLFFMATTNDYNKKKELYSDILKIRKESDDFYALYKGTKLDPYEVDGVKKYDEAVEKWVNVQSKTIALSMANKNAEALKFFYSNMKVVDDFDEVAAGLSEYNVKVADEINTQYKKDANTAFAILTITIFAALGLLISVGLMISSMIVSPIKKAIDNLNAGTNEVSSASSQVAAASQQLAEGTSEQASAVQETSSTLEETSSMVHQNRENTQQAAVLAKQAKQSAEQSNVEMVKMSDSMSELKNSSNEIAKIIKVIDEIAFQTNILSLNAAVEAARAGDAGKGFAVVAEEVRNLAQRSAQAAKDTAVIIESNIDLSDNSVNIANIVRESVESIGEQASKVSGLLDEISVATNEQAQGIEQINKAVSQMEIVLSTNAHTAEEAASAARVLSDQAINVREIVNTLIVLVDGKDALR